MQYLILLGLFLPLIGFFSILLLSQIISRRMTGFIACTTIFLSFFCFLLLLLNYDNTSIRSISYTLYSWIPIAGINADFTLHIDSLSLLMTLIITGIGFLIHVYSTGYMEHDNDFARFFAYMNFFVFSMLLLVLAGHLLLLFVGWEGVGLASYLLIGFWYERPVAANAAFKAFVVNRIGDLGLLLGLLLTFELFGTGNIEQIISLAVENYPLGAPIITVLTLLFFVGATGKSAQIPLQTWLPDAMAGPTPVSALIHAATMVTAGVYLIVRLHAIFLLAPITLEVIGIIGGITALYASLCALGQTDLKKVLAYSTVSQLGLMFLACGAGSFYAAMFHLTSHAFIKALLFLSAGNVLHMTHETTEMEEMGGLAKKLPVTNWLFLIGVLALSGIPPLAAFFSKDLILEDEYLIGYKTLFYIGLIASVLTGVYLTRAYYLTFMGVPRIKNSIYDSIKEAPIVMIVPLLGLALLSLGGGFLGYGLNGVSVLEQFLNRIEVVDVVEHSGSFITPQTIEAMIGAFLGVGITGLIYAMYLNRLKGPVKILRNSFYFDTIYHYTFVIPIKAFSRLISSILEPKFFDHSLTCSTNAIDKTSTLLQCIQSGQIRSYSAWMVIGTILAITYVINY